MRTVKEINNREDFKALDDKYHHRAFYCKSCDEYSLTATLPDEYGGRQVVFEFLTYWPTVHGKWIKDSDIEKLRCDINHSHRVSLVYSDEPYESEQHYRDNRSGDGGPMGGPSNVLQGSAGYHSQH